MQRVQAFTCAAALAAACTVASTGLFAQTPTKPSSNQTATAAKQQSSTDDADFAKRAAADGMKEVEHAKLVASKASNAQVKAFANRLVKDHTAANNELKGIAKRKNIDLPQPPTSEAHDKMAHAEPWMSQKGTAFDKGFIDAEVTDHQKAIELFENEANHGADAELKAFAKKTLPTLRDHLKQAQDLQAKLSTSTQ
jgi:putative membrane protein